MEVEENIEINVTYKNGYNWDLYKKAKELGKKIIITTDIHLSEETIRKILKKNCLKYEQMFWL